jgi:hypothetical protein
MDCGVVWCGVQSPALQSKKDLAGCMPRVLRLVLMDKVPGVYMAGLNVIKVIAGDRILPPRECASLVADVAPVLIDKVKHARS